MGRELTDGELSLGERLLRGEGPEFAELLENLGEAITIRDRADRFVYANRTALRNLGFASIEALRAHPDGSLLDRFLVHDAEGKPMHRADFPTPRLVAADGASGGSLVHVLDRATGTSRWEQIKVTALRDRHGELVATVTMSENVTTVKTAEVHTRLLAETGRILSSSLDYEATVRNVADAAVPGLADWCLVELTDRSGRHRQPLVVAHRDPGMRAVARRLRSLEPAPRGSSAAARVRASGDSELFSEVDGAQLARISRDEAQLEVLRELGPRSAIVVPMRIADRTIGVMSFLTTRSQRRFSESDLSLAEELARRAAVGIENARLHTTLAEVAHTLQESLKPNPLPDLPGWEVAALYLPAAEQERIEVGGDFYEVFDAGPAPLALIGDVTGHGVAAATLTSLMRHGARFSGRLEPEPEAVLRHLDEELRDRASSTMCTALCARIHPRRLVLASAGHPPALHVTAVGDVTETPAPGPLLGAFADAQWPAQTVTVAPGELVLLYTDGITETADDDGERFGTSRLRALLSAHAGDSPQQLLDALVATLERFRGGEPTDDIAALALSPTGD